MLLFLGYKRVGLPCLRASVVCSFNLAIILHFIFNKLCVVLELVGLPLRGVNIHFNIADHPLFGMHSPILHHVERTHLPLTPNTARNDMKQLAPQSVLVLRDLPSESRDAYS